MRLLTYNIHGGIGIDGKRDICRLLTVIEKANADIICLQEVYRRIPNPFYDIVSELNYRLSMTSRFFSTVGTPFAGYGLLTAGHNIDEITAIKLPSIGESRKCVCLYMNAATRFAIANIHMGLDKEERYKQAQYLCNYFCNQSCPLIIAGDFNEPIDANAVQLLIKSLNLNWISSESGPTFPSNNPEHNIDLVLASKSITNYRLIPYSITEASDHLPVLIDIEI